MREDTWKEGNLAQNRKYKYQLINSVMDEIEKDKSKIGVLLCEGDDYAIDKAVYSAIFPEFIVVPVGGCGDIPKIVSRIRKILAFEEIYVFGIIDRDALSKSETKQLYKSTGIYTTKVPFIENIICSPEILSYVCDEMNADYQTVLDKIQTELLRIIWRKMKETLPINLGINKGETIEYLEFLASTGDKSIEKVVDKENVLYAYRSKRIVSIVANELHMRGRAGYYKKIKQMLLDEKYRGRLVKIMRNFVPVIKAYNFEDYY